MKSIHKKLLSLSVFAIAMAFLESAVVIYLRALYYPEGFQFPIKPMDPTLALVEILREAATIIMLIGIAYHAGKTKLQRFAFFCQAFAIWDLFYYIFLFVFLGWPESLFTMDLLFLIPTPWIGPVWAPCLLSLLMLVGAVPVILRSEKNQNYPVHRVHWLLLISGALLCIFSFQWDYLKYCANADLLNLFLGNALIDSIHHYVPLSFNYPLFFCGFAFMTYPVIIHLNLKPNHL